MLSTSTHSFPNTFKGIFLESGKREQASGLLTAISAPGHKAWEANCILETTASGPVLRFIYQSAGGSDASSIWRQWLISSRPLAVCVFKRRWAFRFAPLGPLGSRLSLAFLRTLEQAPRFVSVAPGARDLGRGLL